MSAPVPVWVSRLAGTALSASWCLVCGPTPPAIANPGIGAQSVFIDPGHSGLSDGSLTRQVPNGRGGTKDCQTTGTSTDSGYPEHSLNWSVALLVRDSLEQNGVHTQLSRPSDSELGPCVDRRADDANTMRPSAIVSIHADGGPPWGHGFHVNYSAPPLNDVQAGSAIQLAVTMRDALQGAGLYPSNYAGSEGLYGRPDLAGLNLAQFPAVLIEMGNMRNSDDAAMMTSADGQAKFAQAISSGILDFLHGASHGH